MTTSYLEQVEAVPLREIILDRVPLYSQTAVASEALQRSSVVSHMDHISDRLIVGLETEILSHKVADTTYTMKVPYAVSFRWKHRNRWWMKAILKLFPLTYTSKEAVVRLSREHRFPESTMRYPDHLGKVVVVEQGRLDYTPSVGPCGCPERG